jgi:hypothetical protein
MREQVQKLAFELQVRGLMNVQFAVKNISLVTPCCASVLPAITRAATFASGTPVAFETNGTATL